MKKKNSGGARAGSGRKKKNPTATISIRHDANVIAEKKLKHGNKVLQQLGKQWLESL